MMEIFWVISSMFTFRILKIGLSEHLCLHIQLQQAWGLITFSKYMASQENISQMTYFFFFFCLMSLSPPLPSSDESDRFTRMTVAINLPINHTFKALTDLKLYRGGERVCKMYSFALFIFSFKCVVLSQYYCMEIQMHT